MKELSIFVDESGDLKAQTGTLSRSEELLFHSKRDLKEDFLKGIHKKEF